MDIIAQVKSIDTSVLPDKLTVQINDFIQEADNAKYKDVFLEEYTELGKKLVNTVNQFHESEKEEKRKAAEKEKNKRKPKDIPPAKQAYALFETFSDTVGLNLPLHTTISTEEIDKISDMLAKKACQAQNCFLEGNIIPDQVKKYAKSWLNLQNQKFLKAQEEARKSGRKKIDPANAESCRQALIELKEKASQLNLKKTSATPNIPKPKKQFGTQLVESINRTVKKAAQVRLKNEIDENLSKDFEALLGDAKTFIKSLKKFAGEKASSTLINRLESDLKEVKALIKEKEKVKSSS